jgi:hypothetical protein
MIRSLVVSITTLCMLFFSSAEADRIPGVGIAPYYYYSTDMSAVEVWLGPVWYRTDDEHGIGTIDPVTKKFTEGKSVANFELPRAYITRADPYSSEATHPFFRRNVLPDQIITNKIGVNLIYPSMLPYSVVYQTWPAQAPDLTTPGVGVGIAELSKSRLTRALSLAADVRLSGGASRSSEIFTDKQNRDTGFYKKEGTYEGFEWYRDGGSGHHFYDEDAEDDIHSVHCYNSPQTVNPNFLCTYRIFINEHARVDLKFIDFRAHGGRDFARERIRAFKKFFCPLLNCDPAAIEAMKIGEKRE